MTLSNLSPGTTYHFQLVAYNGAGFSYGGDFTAVTLSRSRPRRDHGTGHRHHGRQRDVQRERQS
jgi:hypothetical protein